MSLNFRFFLAAILIVFTTGKLNSIPELKQESFSQKTTIIIDQQDGSIISNKNSMIYFFISGQQAQQSVKNARRQFQNTATSYLKSKEQNIIISQNSDQQAQNQNSESKVQIQSTQNLENKELNYQKNLNYINFFIVKCPKSQETSNQETGICKNLGIYENQANPKIFFFTPKSQIIRFESQINEDKLFLFIAKIQESSQLFETYVNFDEELQKMASKFELKNISLKNKALGWMQKIKSYLTWDLLKFLVIFGVLPFLFGYLSSKSQQKANKKRMQKYGANTEQETQKKSKQPKELKKQ